MSRFLILILGWVLFIAALSVLVEVGKLKQVSESGDVIETIEAMTESGSVDPQLLEEISQAYQSGDYLRTLHLMDRHESDFSSLPTAQSAVAHLFYYMKGYVHTELWQYVEAEQSWQVALALTTDTARRNKIKGLLKASQYMLDDLNHERNQKTLYHASPNVGPASSLQGRIAVMYVFLTDGALQSWSVRKRDFVISNWRQVENWFRSNSQQYNNNLEFSHRLFVVDKNPYIKRLRVGDFNDNYQHADTVAVLVAENFGFTSLQQFMNEIKREEKADQAILLLHLARDGRSFATRCMYHCKSDSEYVFLMENARSREWQSLGYVQAHETLHLFGADDLYNIKDAKDYAVRDIMNYPSSILEANTIEPITAYAIGLDITQPKAPFRIKNYTPSEISKK